MAFMAAMIFILFKQAIESEKDVDWVRRRLHVVEKRIAVMTKSDYHPEAHAREFVRENLPYGSQAVCQLFSRDGEQLSVTFGKLPMLISWGSAGRYILRTDLEPQEMQERWGKTYNYKTLVLEGATRQEVLDHVDRVAPQIGLFKSLLFVRETT